MGLLTVPLALLISFLSLNSICAQDDAPTPKYEMTTYYMAFLKKGPKWSPEITEQTKEVQAAHLRNIEKLEMKEK